MQVPAPFDYARAESVEDALALLARHGPGSRVVAGGHSLLPMMKLRLARPDCLVDINELYELDYVLRDGDVLRVGAMVRHTALLESTLVGELLPVVHDAERVIADPVVRNRGTIGGSLCQADPAEDLSTVCTVLGASAVLRGPRGQREVSMDELHRGPYQTCLEHDELLVEVRFPLRPRSGSAYEKVERRVGDWAVAAAGASVALQADGTVAAAAVGLTAVGLDAVVPGVADLLVGRVLGEDLVARAGGLAAQACDPVADARGPVDYKRHLADELTRRVLRRAADRAGDRGAAGASEGED